MIYPIPLTTYPPATKLRKWLHDYESIAIAFIEMIAWFKQIALIWESHVSSSRAMWAYVSTVVLLRRSLLQPQLYESLDSFRWTYEIHSSFEYLRFSLLKLALVRNPTRYTYSISRSSSREGRYYNMKQNFPDMSFRNCVSLFLLYVPFMVLL